MQRLEFERSIPRRAKPLQACLPRPVIGTPTLNGSGVLADSDHARRESQRVPVGEANGSQLAHLPQPGFVFSQPVFADGLLLVADEQGDLSAYRPTDRSAPVVGIAADVSSSYWVVTSEGNVYSYGNPWYGSKGGQSIPASVVGMAVDPKTGGYWLVTSKGNVYNFNAPFYGSKGQQSLPAPVVGMAADPTTGGYWLVTSLGNVYNYNAPFYGSHAHQSIPAPVVGMAVDPKTGGYWLVTSKGNVYNYNAPFYGSKAQQPLPAPVVGMAADPITGGYWLVTSRGNVYNYNAPFEGSLADQSTPSPVVGMTADPTTGGYWLVTSHGNTFNYNAAGAGGVEPNLLIEGQPPSSAATVPHVLCSRPMTRGESTTVQVSVDIPQAVAQDAGAVVGSYCTRAEELGFAGLWTMDDVLSARPFLDPLGVLGYAAAVTKRVTLGVAVLIVSHHNPVVLAKQFSTLDNLSGGRLVVGVGVGHDNESTSGIGFPAKGLGVRSGEVIGILKALWTERRASFEGTLWHFADLPMEPKPVQRPHPPIWLGGNRPPALRRAAEVADGWIGAGSSSTADFAERVKVLAGFLSQAGRKVDEFPVASAGS